MKNLAKLSVAVCVTLLAGGCGIVPGTSIETIEPGYTGLKIELYGGDKGIEKAVILPGGRIWYNGYTEKVVVFPTFVRSYPWTRDPSEGSSNNEEIVFSVGGTPVAADIGITYGFYPDERLKGYYGKYRVDSDQFRSGLLRNAVRDCIAASAENLNLIPSALPTSQQKLLITSVSCVQKKFPEVNIEGLSLLSPFRLPENIQQSIDAQFKAKQDAQTAEANRQKAEAEAKANVATAKGEAQAEIERAIGTAKANEIMSKSLTPQLLKLKELEVKEKEIAKWNGVKPSVTVQSPNAQVAVPNP
jgi:regulator of protease activity HflC (stomatin/prohibitin superfamily)